MAVTAPAGLVRPGDRARRQAVEHSGDLVRLGLAVALLGLSTLAIQRSALSVFERDVFRLVNDLPEWLVPFFEVVMQLGNMVAPFVIGLVVIVGMRRTRIGLTVMAAGALGWVLSQALKDLVQRGRPHDFLDELMRVGSGGGAGFVSGHTAVATAMAAALAPNLPRRWRRVVWAVPVLVAMGRMYSGVHLPLDLVGGFAVGWFAGTLVHMVVGVDPPRRTPEAVAEVLARLGLDVASVEPAPVEAAVAYPFRVTTVDGRRLFAKFLDPDPRRTDWVLRLARIFASRERRHVSALVGLAEAADHEAAVIMAARDTGARVPAVVVARGVGNAAVVVLEEVPEGRDLTQVEPGALSEDVLRELWTQVALLRHGRIAHRDLVRANVMLDGSSRPWLVDFFDAQVGASDDALDGDVAELIASLAVVVGPERAVGSAAAVLGAEAVDRALPRLETFALSAVTRGELAQRPGLLDAVRAAAGGSPNATAGVLDLHRVLVPALAALVGYTVLLAIAGWDDVVAEVQAATLRWVLVAGAVFVLVPPLHGYALQVAAHRRVAVGRSAAASALAGSMEVIAGTAARRHLLRRYLRSCGARGHDPENAVHLVLSAELAAAALMLVGALGLGAYRGTLSVHGSLAAAGLAAVALVAASAGWAVRRRARRAFDRPSLRADFRTARAMTRRSPGRTLGVLAAKAAGEVALVLALASALRSVGPWPSVAVVVVALSGVRVLMAVLGLAGLPVVGEALVSAMLVLLGVPVAEAVVGVIVYATYRYWLTAAVSAVASPRLAPMHVREIGRT